MMLMQLTEVKETSICLIGKVKELPLDQFHLFQSVRKKAKCNQGEFLVESKETKQKFTLVVKEEVTTPAEILKKMRPLLEEFKGVVHDELPEGLQPMRDI